MKRCTKCGMEKDKDEFYKRAKSFDGLTSMCKECIKERQRQYYHSGNGKQVVETYRATPRGQEVYKRASAKYENSKKGRETRRQYSRSEHARALSRKREATARAKETRKKHEQTEKRKQWKAEYRRRLWEGDKKKQIQAMNAVNGEVRNGRMPPVSEYNCVRCERKGHRKKAEEYHHYNGYEERHWLDVTPLCVVCHRAVHREMNQ